MKRDKSEGKRDESLRAEINGAKPIKLTIKVTPEIRRREFYDGRPVHSLHYVIESGGLKFHPEQILSDNRTEYIGTLEGEVWETVKKEWLAEYRYVRERIKKATVLMAGFLTAEASLALRDDVEWGAFFDEIRGQMDPKPFIARFAEMFPAGPRDGSFSYQTASRVDAHMMLLFYVVFMKGRFVDSSINNEDIDAYITKVANLAKWGGIRNVKAADLPDNIRKKLGSRYVELKESFTKLKRDASAFASAFNDWQSPILKKYPILEKHQDLLKHIDPYYVPQDADASDRILDQWEIAMQITAREVIPHYESIPLVKRPSAETLRKRAILPPEKL